VDWSLLGCGRSGHVTYAPDEPALRDRLSARTPAGTAWRCLRCGTFVTGDADRTGPADEAPRVRRGDQVRSVFILRVFAIERYLRAIVFGVAAYVVWRFEFSRTSLEQAFSREFPLLRTLFKQLGYDIDHSKLVGLIQHALTLSNGTIRLLAAGLAAYAAIELIEGTGLWLAKRWGEYFAMVATSVFLPYEIYDLTAKITVTRILFFAVNLALVLYLVITKRLFGVRGGKRAYVARLRSESIMDTAIAEASASRVAAATRPASRVAAAPGGQAPGGQAPGGQAPGGQAPGGQAPGSAAGSVPTAPPTAAESNSTARRRSPTD
jgi:uncharacterized membrane protein (DUF2068 family)